MLTLQVRPTETTPARLIGRAQPQATKSQAIKLRDHSARALSLGTVPSWSSCPPCLIVRPHTEASMTHPPRGMSCVLGLKLKHHTHESLLNLESVAPPSPSLSLPLYGMGVISSVISHEKQAAQALAHSKSLIKVSVSSHFYYDILCLFISLTSTWFNNNSWYSLSIYYLPGTTVGI